MNHLCKILRSEEDLEMLSEVPMKKSTAVIIEKIKKETNNEITSTKSILRK